MDRSLRRTLRKAARMTTLYIVVIGVAVIILFPLYFLVVISLMSDYEAYQWPLPLTPSFKSEFRIEPLSGTDDDYHLYIRNVSTGRFDPFGPVSFTSGTQDLESVSQFLLRQANVSVSPEILRQEVDKAAQQGSTDFSSGKSLLQNYRVFFAVTRDAPASVGRSILTALITIIISLTIGGMAGFAFVRYGFKGKNVLKLSVLFVRMFPGVAIAIPMVITLGRIGLYDQPVGLSLIYSVGHISLTIWITASIFLSIPVSLEEAALIFGTTKVGAFRYVTLPLALPGLAACAMYSFIGSWNEVVQAIVLTQFNPTFPVVVYQALVGAGGNVNLLTAGSIAQAFPAVIFTLLIRRYILQMWGGVRV